MNLTFKCDCGNEVIMSFSLFVKMGPEIKCGCGRLIVKNGVYLPSQSQVYGDDCPNGVCDV